MDLLTHGTIASEHSHSTISQKKISNKFSKKHNIKFWKIVPVSVEPLWIHLIAHPILKRKCLYSKNWPNIEKVSTPFSWKVGNRNLPKFRNKIFVTITINGRTWRSCVLGFWWELGLRFSIWCFCRDFRRFMGFGNDIIFVLYCVFMLILLYLLFSYVFK